LRIFKLQGGSKAKLVGIIYISFLILFVLFFQFSLWEQIKLVVFVFATCANCIDLTSQFNVKDEKWLTSKTIVCPCFYDDMKEIRKLKTSSMHDSHFLMLSISSVNREIPQSVSPIPRWHALGILHLTLVYIIRYKKSSYWGLALSMITATQLVLAMHAFWPVTIIELILRTTQHEGFVKRKCVRVHNINVQYTWPFNTKSKQHTDK